ncbi:MAG: DUF1902 domain-containing protein [Gemmobacter sp.]
MKNQTIIVRADWDDDARVWVATTSDIRGLAVEAATFDLLREAVNGAVADLIQENGFETDLPEVAVQILGQSILRIAVAA